MAYQRQLEFLVTIIFSFSHHVFIAYLSSVVLLFFSRNRGFKVLTTTKNNGNEMFKSYSKDSNFGTTFKDGTSDFEATNSSRPGIELNRKRSSRHKVTSILNTDGSRTDTEGHTEERKDRLIAVYPTKHSFCWGINTFVCFTINS